MQLHFLPSFIIDVQCKTSDTTYVIYFSFQQGLYWSALWGSKPFSLRCTSPWVHHMHSHLPLLSFSVDSTLRDVLKLHLAPHRHNPAFQGINTVWGKTLTTGLWEPIEKYSQLVLRCISSSFSHSYTESEIVHPQYSQPDNTSSHWLHLLFLFVILSSSITFLSLTVFSFSILVQSLELYLTFGSFLSAYKHVHTSLNNNNKKKSKVKK